MKNLRFQFEKFNDGIALGMAGDCQDILRAHYQLVNAGAVSNTAKCKKGRRGNESFLHWLSGDETGGGRGFAYVILPSVRAFVNSIVWAKLNVMEARPNGTKRVKRGINRIMARKMAARFIRENRPRWVGVRRKDDDGQWVRDPEARGFIVRNRAGEAMADIAESDLMATASALGDEPRMVSRKSFDSTSMPSVPPDEEISADSHTDMEEIIEDTPMGLEDDNPIREDFEEPSDGFMSDAEADGDALASAGWGTDEDYGGYGDGD